MVGHRPRNRTGDIHNTQYDVLIPVWKGSEKNVDVFKQLGYTFIESYDDADGFIERPRLGFMVKNNTGE